MSLTEGILVALMILYIAGFMMATKSPVLRERLRKSSNDQIVDMSVQDNVHHKRFVAGLVYVLTIVVMPYLALTMMLSFMTIYLRMQEINNE